MNKANFKEALTKSVKFHGGLCLGIVLGTRIALAGLNKLKISPTKAKDLVVFVEMDRCISDAIQAITGCSLGKRRLKFRDYGKFAASFMDLASEKGVRVSIKPNIPKLVLNPIMKSDLKSGINLAVEEYYRIEDNNLLMIEPVEIFLSEYDLPGKPKSKMSCNNCREMIFDNKGIDMNGKNFCKACLGDGYYRSIGD